MLFNRELKSADLSRRVDELHVQALQADDPALAATPLNQAGDLLARAGDLGGALELYGRAVDSLVEAERLEPAMALCKKIIRAAPAVIRARCTLTWLAIGAGYTGEAGSRLSDYVMAADTGGHLTLARHHVRQMDAVVEAHELRIMLGEYLLYLGDDEAANVVFGAIFSERNTGRLRIVDESERWRNVRRAALLDPSRCRG